VLSPLLAMAKLCSVHGVGLLWGGLVGPTGKVIAALSDSDREKVQASVRARLSAGPDGSVTHSARANAIKALVPK
jgi:hypothetical protein